MTPETIRAAFLQHRTVRATALALRISSRTLFRWLRADPSIATAGVDRAGSGSSRGPTENPPTIDPALTRAEREDLVMGALVAGVNPTEAARRGGLSPRTVRRWARGVLQHGWI
jgi:transposase-like protein